MGHSHEILVVISWLLHWNQIWVFKALTEVNELCSWVRLFTLTLVLSTKWYKCGQVMHGEISGDLPLGWIAFSWIFWGFGKMWIFKIFWQKLEFTPTFLAKSSIKLNFKIVPQNLDCSGTIKILWKIKHYGRIIMIWHSWSSGHGGHIRQNDQWRK